MKGFQYLLIVLLALASSSCGGGGPTTTIDVTLSEFSFTPNTFTVPAGQEISINAQNNGAVVHNFIVMNLDTSVGEEFNSEDEANIYWQLEIQPGQDSTATFTAPSEPGDYQIVCSTPGHYVAGMIGTLTVVAGE